MDADEFTMYYNYSDQNEFETKVNEIISQNITSEMTTNEKIKAIYDYLILNVTYDNEGYQSENISNESHSAYGAIVLGKAVCDGYTDALNLLLNRLGIESDIVIGQANDEGHAWNLIKFSDGYFYADATWDDGDDGKLRYDFYKKTEAQMETNHEIEKIVK